MNCGNCGKTIEENAVVCPYCGALTGAEEQAAGGEKSEGAGEKSMVKGKEQEREAGKAGGPSVNAAGGGSREASAKQMAGIGISVAFFAALIYWSGLIAGMPVITVLLAGYVLIREKDQWLRAVALKAVTILVFFAVLLGLVGLLVYFKDVIVDIINMLLSTISMNGEANSITGKFFTDILDILQYIILFIRDAFLIISGYLALQYRNLPVPVIDRMVNQHIGRIPMK